MENTSATQIPLRGPCNACGSESGQRRRWLRQRMRPVGTQSVEDDGEIALPEQGAAPERFSMTWTGAHISRKTSVSVMSDRMSPDSRARSTSVPRHAWSSSRTAVTLWSSALADWRNVRSCCWRWSAATVRNSSNAAPGSVATVSRRADSTRAAMCSETSAAIRSSFVAKCRNTVPFATPARRAMSATDADRPRSANSSSAAASSNPRFRAASARIGRRAGSRPRAYQVDRPVILWHVD